MNKTIATFGILLALSVAACDSGGGDGGEDLYITPAPGSNTGGNCVDVETALKEGWRGDPESVQASLICAAACVPGRNREANCGTLRAWPSISGERGRAARQCTYCQ